MSLQMTLEEIWKQNGINTRFAYTDDHFYTYTIVGRWKYGILYTTQCGNDIFKNVYRLKFEQNIDEYEVLP